MTHHVLCNSNAMHHLQDGIKLASLKASEAEQAKRDSQAAGRSRVKREKEEHAARGPVPEPWRDFRLPQDKVPALLMVWELTQVKAACGDVQLSYHGKSLTHNWCKAFVCSMRILQVLHVDLPKHTLPVNPTGKAASLVTLPTRHPSNHLLSCCDITYQIISTVLLGHHLSSHLQCLAWTLSCCNASKGQSRGT